MHISTQKNHIERLCELHHFNSIFSKELLPYVEIHTFQKKEPLSQEGEPFPYLYFMVKGKAKVYMTHKNGQRTLVLFAEAPCFLGEMSLLEVEPFAKGVTAMEDITCLALPLATCKSLLLDDTIFLRNLSRILAEKARNRSETLAKSYAYPFENRFAAFILISASDGVYNEMHTEVAEFLNVSYRHLLFTLQDFVVKGVLEKEGRNYIIRNYEFLEKLRDEIVD